MTAPTALATPATSSSGKFASWFFFLLTAWLPSWVTPSNLGMQVYSLILTTMLVIILVEGVFFQSISPQEHGEKMMKLVITALGALLIVGFFLLPASGKLADFLLLHAVGTTVMLIGVLLIGLIVHKTEWNFFWLYVLWAFFDLLVITCVRIRSIP